MPPPLTPLGLRGSIFLPSSGDTARYILPKLHPKKREEIYRLGIRFIVVVRGSKTDGSRPHINLGDATYTGKNLDERWDLVGRKLVVYVQEDAREVMAYEMNGSRLGLLRVYGQWADFPHPWELRELVLKKKGVRVTAAPSSKGHMARGLSDGWSRRSAGGPDGPEWTRFAIRSGPLSYCLT